MKKRGFTLVELAIVIAIMAVLLILSVAGVRASQLNARDTDRRVDAETIANTMESLYDMTDETKVHRGYPSRVVIDGWLQQYTTSNLLTDRLSEESLRSPDVSKEDPPSLTIADNSNQDVNGVRPIPTPSRYVYQVLTKNNASCFNSSSNCVKFNLYYGVERPRDGCTNNICVIRSKRQ